MRPKAGGKSGRRFSKRSGWVRTCCSATLRAVSPRNGGLPGQHVVASHAQAVDVAARIELPAFDLLRAHVQRRAHGDAHLRELQRLFPAADAGQTEIGHFHFAGAGEHDIFRLDVAVDDAAVGGFAQGGGHLPDDGQAHLHIGRALAGNVLRQVLPFDIFLGDVMEVVNQPDFVNLHDVGLHQRRGGLGFHVEPADVGIVGGQFPFEHFERHLAAERTLLGQIHIGHRPATQPPQQAIIA